MMVLAGAAVLSTLVLAGNAREDGAERQKNAENAESSQRSAPPAFLEALPRNVEDMRSAILAAARSGEIEELTVPFEWNELPPMLGKGRIEDPIAHLKSQSRDGDGLEILAVLVDLLSLPPSKLHLGRDAENSAVFVWPYLAEQPIKDLTPAQKVELFSIMPPETAAAVMNSGKWTWWRLTIGADGTWHSFMKHEH